MSLLVMGAVVAVFLRTDAPQTSVTHYAGAGHAENAKVQAILSACHQEAIASHGEVQFDVHLLLTVVSDGSVRWVRPERTNLKSGQVESWQAFEACAFKKITRGGLLFASGSNEFTVGIQFSTDAN